MKRFLILALLFIVVSNVFAIGPLTVGSAHAESGYDNKDMAVAVVVNAVEQGRMWLNANYSYLLLSSEIEELLNLVQTAAKKIDIAIANKCTVCYLQEVGRFYTDSAALVTVSFETQSYESCNTVVQVMNGGNYDILLLNKKDTQDFIKVLRSAHNLVDDHQRQIALFK